MMLREADGPDSVYGIGNSVTAEEKRMERTVQQQWPSLVGDRLDPKRCLGQSSGQRGQVLGPRSAVRCGSGGSGGRQRQTPINAAISRRNSSSSWTKSGSALGGGLPSDAPGLERQDWGW